MKSADSTVAQSRRNFLRGNFSNQVRHIRPPWALGDRRFAEQCTRCNDCIDACPERMLSHAEDGYPYASFIQSGCTFCRTLAEGANLLAGADQERILQGIRSDRRLCWGDHFGDGRAAEMISELLS